MIEMEQTTHQMNKMIRARVNKMKENMHKMIKARVIKENMNNKDPNAMNNKFQASSLYTIGPIND
jgi:hypothetical protein